MGLWERIRSTGRLIGYKDIERGTVSEDRLDSATRAKLTGGSSTITQIPYTANTTGILGDAGANNLVTLTVASANTYTIPPNSSVAFPIGSVINIASLGAGQTTIIAGAGVTINPASTLKLRVQYSSATLIKTATDTWILIGDIAS